MFHSWALAMHHFLSKFEKICTLLCFVELVIWVLDCSPEITTGTFLETHLICQTKAIEICVKKKKGWILKVLFIFVVFIFFKPKSFPNFPQGKDFS